MTNHETYRRRARNLFVRLVEAGQLTLDDVGGAAAHAARINAIAMHTTTIRSAPAVRFVGMPSYDSFTVLERLSMEGPNGEPH